MMHLRLPTAAAAILGASLATATSQPAEPRNLNERCALNESLRRRLIQHGLSAEERVSELLQLAQDLEALNTEIRSAKPSYPKNFLDNCMRKKAELVALNSKMASDSIRDSFDWLVAMGDLARFDGKILEAQKLYERALTKKPGEYNLRQKLALVWKDKVFLMIQKGEIPKGDLKALQGLYDQTLAILKPLLEDPNAPGPLKADYFVLKGLLLDSMDRFSEAIPEFKQALVHNPKNRFALINVASFAYARKQWAEARRAYETLASLDRPRLEIQLILLELQARDGDWPAMASTAEEGLKIHPGNAELDAYAALAQLGLKDRAGAEKRARAVLKKAPKNPVARRTIARSHFERGQEARASGSPGIALSEFDKAYRLDSSMPELREAMALVIYDARRAEGPQKNSATLADLRRVIELLNPIVASSERAIDSKVLLAHMQSAFFTGSLGIAARSCSRYDEEFGSLSDPELVLQCARALSAGGQTAKARAVLKRAIDGGRFTSSERRLVELLNSLN